MSDQFEPGDYVVITYPYNLRDSHLTDEDLISAEFKARPNWRKVEGMRGTVIGPCETPFDDWWIEFSCGTKMCYSGAYLIHAPALEQLARAAEAE